MTMADFNMTQNSIVSMTTFNPETGGQVTTYRNVNGVWSGRMMGMWSQPLRNKAWQVSAHMFGMYNQRVGFNNGARNRLGTFCPALPSVPTIWNSNFVRATPYNGPPTRSRPPAI